jgi:hypothetical protein
MYGAKCAGSHWSMLLLAEYGVDGSDTRVRQAARHMLEDLAAGDTGMEWATKRDHGVSCYFGNIVRYVAAAGYGLMSRVASAGNYLTAVLPAVVVMSVGMAVSVTPLTTTVMAAVDDRHAGVASGINNAISRLASLLAVALVGLLSAGAFAAALDRVALVAAGLSALAAASAAALIRPARS